MTNPVNRQVVGVVEDYVEKERRDAAKYDNRTPLDETGIWSLHRMAAVIYTLGYQEGEAVEAARNQRLLNRQRDSERDG